MAFPSNPRNGQLIERNGKVHIWTEKGLSWTVLPFTLEKIQEIIDGTIGSGGLSGSETLTTLVHNGGGSYTYTSEDSTVTNFSTSGTDVKVASGAISGTDLILTMSDATSVTIDATSMLLDVKVASGAVVGTDLVLTMSDTTTVTIDATTLLADINVSAVVYNAGTDALDFTVTGGVDFSVDVSALLPVTTDGTLTGDGGAVNLGVNQADAISPASDDATGAIGASAQSAKEDHKHPAQGVSADANNSLTIGTDGLHMADLTGLAADAISPASTDATGAIGTETQLSREDHKHPAQAQSADVNNIIKLGADGLHHVSLDASAFSGNLATTDDTLQEVSDAFDQYKGNDRLFADDTTVAPAVAGIPTEAEVATFAGTSRDTIIYYTGNDTNTDPVTYAYHIDKSGSVTLLYTVGGTDTNFATDDLTSTGNRTHTFNNDLTISGSGHKVLTTGFHKLTVDGDVQMYSSGTAGNAFVIADGGTTNTDASLRVFDGSDQAEFKLRNNTTNGFEAYFHTKATVDGTAVVGQVPQLLNSTTGLWEWASAAGANDRIHADSTTVAAALPGDPTNAEIAIFAGLNRDTIIYYTGSDTDTDPEKYVYHIDNTGNVTLIFAKPDQRNTVGTSAGTTTYDEVDFREINEFTFKTNPVNTINLPSLAVMSATGVDEQSTFIFTEASTVTFDEPDNGSGSFNGGVTFAAPCVVTVYYSASNNSYTCTPFGDGGINENGVVPAAVLLKGIYTAEGTNPAVSLFAAVDSQSRVMVSSTAAGVGTVIGVQVGESLNGVTDGTYTTQSDGELLLFIDNGVGAWTVQVVGASLMTDLHFGRMSNNGSTTSHVTTTTSLVTQLYVDYTGSGVTSNPVTGEYTIVNEGRYLFDAYQAADDRNDRTIGALFVDGVQQGEEIYNIHTSTATADFNFPQVYLTAGQVVTFKLRTTPSGDAIGDDNIDGIVAYFNCRQIAGASVVLAGMVTPTLLKRTHATLSTNEIGRSIGIIAFDTDNGGSVPMAAGVFSLEAGKTYDLESQLKVFRGSGNFQVEYQWQDSVLGTALAGLSTATTLSIGGSSADSGQTNAGGFYTPSVDQTIKLELSVASDLFDLDSTGSYAQVNELPASTIIAMDPTLTPVLDEDDMVSDSDTSVPTQQSTKAYVDGEKMQTGTTAPVDGTTVAYFVGQLYWDNVAKAMYEVTTASTAPYTAATGSVWAVVTLGNPQFIATFDNSADWAGPIIGLYTHTVLAATHGLGAAVTTMQVQELLGGTSFQLVTPESVTVNATGDIFITVSDVPDGRFAGRIIIGA